MKYSLLFPLKSKGKKKTLALATKVISRET